MGGLKSIELQVALPRTQTAGKIQDQLQQRGPNVQHHISQNQLEESVKKRTQVTETEHAEKKRLNNDSEKEKKNSQQYNKKQMKVDSKGEDFEDHPFKGKHFDVKW
ncbi:MULTISPECIES: hypothetical protein [Bacillaceae]|uniref:Uncharacterized protein n=1 Tax=Evansella alkalicola TaxID=745819 RepID=A0ABS6JQG7_9BACI|nr:MULTISPECIES: hypothetical protein [Bacillaceae]MBU9720346.1 hypothetical protein [Bacillus alkalicola]